MVIHSLKIWPEFFEAVRNGTKPFEIRRNDRGFEVGDVLRLEEFEPEEGEKTGRVIEKVISYVTGFEQKEGFVVLGLTGPEALRSTG